MRRQFDLPNPPSIEHDDVLRCWRWFRLQLIEICEFHGLPTSFSEHDGEIAIIERVQETRARFSRVPLHDNYNSRGQTLRFQDDDQRVEIHIFRSDRGDYFQFSYHRSEMTDDQVRFYVSTKTSYVELDDRSSRVTQWEEALLPFATAT